MEQRSQLVAAARQFLGVRFAHQGRGAHGLDCLGLLIASAAEAGITLRDRTPESFDERSYGARPDTNYLQATLERHLQPVRGNLQPGDMLLLRIEGRPQHLALVSDYPEAGELGMIHAYAMARKVVEHRLDAHWRNEIHAAYCLPEN